MDAQNAVGSDQAKSVDRGASPTAPRDANKTSDRRNLSPSATKSVRDDSSTFERFTWAAADDDDLDSDAETVVLPGKDGHSPSKVRKMRQEDKSDGEGNPSSKSALATSRPKNGHDGPVYPLPRPADASAVRVKKERIAGSLDKDRHGRAKDASSGLSSAPNSPPRRRRRHSDDSPRSSPSASDHSRRRPTPKAGIRDRSTRPSERVHLYKRKAPNIASVESDDEGETRKVRRQRTNSVGMDSSRLSKDESRSTLSRIHNDARDGSASPHYRSHRRSASSQLPSQTSNGLSQKKKRLPPPLQPTAELSDDSSASGSPHPRSTKLRSLVTPALTDSNLSPAKMAPPKKHLDAHGQTMLARACARGDYEGVKYRLSERPVDLNVADYAGNTPLQIAAINGREDIVKLLLDAGCNLDCVNYDKDTPLLDAVDNGHLGVVKLLLNAGVNPRKANVHGEEPYDRVDEDTENGEEIRQALMDAKKRTGERRRTSEDRQSQTEDARESNAPDSPRRSPAAPGHAAGSRRSGTMRSTKTRNDLLYMPLDDKTLRQAAGRGDEETVARILQVKEGYDDPESMVAAARGGHDLVIQLLLGLGGANPDPDPVPSLQPEFATPILAAIGQENINVLALLLNQQGFDPTRRFKAETYYEIARRRQGANWKEEEELLKNAYDEHKRTLSGKGNPKSKSPARRGEEKRTRREDREARTHRRTGSSPSRDAESLRKSAAKLSSPKDGKHPNSLVNSGDDNLAQKRSSARARRDERTAAAHPSEREISPNVHPKFAKSKRADSEAGAVSSDGEAVKPRRKLISKGKLRGERDKNRRTSLTSNASSLRDPSSPNEPRHDDVERHNKVSEKYHDRTKALKRDESRDRSAQADGSAKRHRASTTPDRPSNGDKDDEAPFKRRRLDSLGQERQIKRAPSADSSKRNREGLPRSHEGSAEVERQGQRDAKTATKASHNDKTIHIKSEDLDTDMLDATHNTGTEDEHRRQREIDEEQATKLRRAEVEEKKRLEIEKGKKREQEEEASRKREEAEKETRRKQQELEARKKQEEEAAKKRQEAEEAVRQEEERRRKEEEEKEEKRRAAEEQKRKEDEERKRKEEERKRAQEEERKRKEEAERLQREEEERLHREQIEREAAEEAQRKREQEEREEQERLERLERERLHREEMERKRAAREAEQRRIREEQERARLEKLPPLLRWFDRCPIPQTTQIADLFRHIQGARYDTIRPEFNRTSEGREQWVLSAHAALLLGEKDLTLSRYTAWAREPANELGKLTLWRVEWSMYSLLDRDMWHLGRQLPGCYGGKDPSELTREERQRLKESAWEKIRAMELFWVRLSDVLYTVPKIPHLRGLEIDVEYRELIETDAMAMKWGTLQKWKTDPNVERFLGFAPRHAWYVDGDLVREEVPARTQISKTPFVEKRVPRRGLQAVSPDDPEYDRLCKEQGLGHLIKGQTSQPLANGVQVASVNEDVADLVASTMVNGHTKSDVDKDAQPTEPNGINGSAAAEE